MAGTLKDLYEAIARIKKEYPGLAYLLNIPEVGKLVLQKVAGTLDGDKFLAALMETKWYKTTDKNRRELIDLAALDPATYKQMVTQKAAEMKDEAGRLGLTLTGAQLTQGAHFALNMGFNDAQMADFLGNQFKFQRNKIYGGEFGATMTELARIAHDEWLIPLSQDGMFGKAKKIVSGESTLEAEQQNMMKNAIARYAHLKDDILEGATLGELTEPYRQLIAAEMDVGVEQVDLVDDTRWRDVMSFQEGDKVRMMTMNEALRHTRRQNGWSDTSVAREKASALGEDLARTFGAVGQGAASYSSAGGVGGGAR